MPTWSVHYGDEAFPNCISQVFELSPHCRLLGALLLVRSLLFSQHIEIFLDLSIPQSVAFDSQRSNKSILCTFFSVFTEADRKVQAFLSESTWLNRINPKILSQAVLTLKGAS